MIGHVAEAAGLDPPAARMLPRRHVVAVVAGLVAVTQVPETAPVKRAWIETRIRLHFPEPVEKDDVRGNAWSVVSDRGVESESSADQIRPWRKGDV